MTANAPRRLHVTGGPGSGKTSAAKRLAAALGAPVYHLDEMALDLEAEGRRDYLEVLARRLPALVEQEAWVSEGAYLG